LRQADSSAQATTVLGAEAQKQLWAAPAPSASGIVARSQ
jgi:hypothetical protein